MVALRKSAGTMQTFTSNENFRRFHGHHATKKSATAYFKQNHFKIFFRLVYIQIFERLETSKDFAGLRFRKWPGNYDFCGYNLKWKTKTYGNCSHLMNPQNDRILIDINRTFRKISIVHCSFARASLIDCCISLAQALIRRGITANHEPQ